MRPSQRLRTLWWRLLLTAVVAVFVPVPAAGQAPLYLADEETTVSDISFRFVEEQTFEESQLRKQLATQAPGFFARLGNGLSFLPGLSPNTSSFDPVALQRDVARLRRFYREHGFPEPSIDYPESRLDTSDNQVQVIFTIREGPPQTIHDVTFRTADGTQPLRSQLEDRAVRAWTQFRTESTVQPGERYTDLKRTQIENDVRTWLRNRGYAFAEVQSEVQIDSTRATLRVLADPGPLGRVSEIRVEGNESVSDAVVRRELPFDVGDQFSASGVTDGQRALFDLNLFRVALADVPEQFRDSTVAVRYRVREANLRAYSGQVGYGTQVGVALKGSWRHRNFLGQGRSFVVGVTADTGVPQDPAGIIPVLPGDDTKTPNRLFRTSVTFRQPYLFTDRLAGTLEPFAQERRNPALSPRPDRDLQLLEDLRLNERQIGLNTTLIYDLLPFRSVSLRHSFSRTEQFRGTREGGAAGAQPDDLFDKSVFSLSGTFGQADDFLNPSRGIILRPTVEVGHSGVEFVSVGGEVSGYVPLSDEIQFAGRLFGGLLRPFSGSRTNLTVPSTASDSLRQRNRQYQDRFSDHLFYAGGSSDVRGWTSQLGGGKVLRDLSPDTTSSVYAYRPVGARSKLGLTLEMRLPFPGLSDSWRTAVFVDGAYLDTGGLTLTPPTNVSGVVSDADGQAVATDRPRLLVGTGVGLRYKTPFGFVRLDAAYKLTPDDLDLRRPEEVGERVAQGEPATAAPTRSLRRFRLHFGIGRSF